MVETYLFYSSLTLVAIGCLTLVLFILFRLKCHQMNSLPRNFSANVFDKTFNVFNPYPKQRRIIHNFLFMTYMIPVIMVIISWWLAPLALLKGVESGLSLSLVLLFICLNLILIDNASEIFLNATRFINAFNNKSDLGVGDLKVFQTLERVIPKLSNYYLALSVVFLTLSATLGYIWPSLLSFFGRVMALIFEIQALTGGAIAFEVPVILFLLIFSVVLILIRKIKSNLLNYLLGN